MTEPESPLVSVIVPVYNVKPYLNEALDSVVNQTYKNLEIILIDDGSTDGSGEICDEYAARDNRIIVIHQTNQGLSAARNAGLDIMRGSIVSFLDSDDAFHPQMIKTMLSTMLRDKADVVVCKYSKECTEYKLDIKGRIEPNITPGIYNRNLTLQCLVDKRLNISIWNKIYIASIWKTIRFPVGKVFEDIAVMPIYYKINKASVLPDILYLHRKRAGSIMTTVSLQRFKDWLHNYKDTETFIEQHTPEIFTEKQRQMYYQRKVTEMIVYYVRMVQNKTNSIETKRVRSAILENAKGIRLTKARVWCAYQMLHYCPAMLSVFCPIYYFIRTGATKL